MKRARKKPIVSPRWLRRLRQLSRNLSVKAGIFCLGAVATALLAVVLAPFVPDQLAELVGGDAVTSILTVLSSSMLAVVTFSLSTLIASYSVARSSAPSRATSLIMRDRSAQTALSTFLGAFIFSMVSLVALSTRYYGPKGRVILFLVTLAVLIAVVWRIVRWIGRLSGLGQLDNVIREVEEAARSSIRSQPYCFVSEDATPKAPSASVAVCTSYSGFVQAIDIPMLSELADGMGWDIYLGVAPGKFVYPGLALVKVLTKDQISDDCRATIREAFILDSTRTFDEDPRFGFVVLSEIGSQALSPGINDPGTAIQVIGSLMRLITEVRKKTEEPGERFWSERLHVKPISIEDVLDDAFHAISRDGASISEVAIFLQKCLGSLSAFSEFKEAARALSLLNLERCKQAMRIQEDFERVKGVALNAESVAAGPRICL